MNNINALLFLLIAPYFVNVAHSQDVQQLELVKTFEGIPDTGRVTAIASSSDSSLLAFATHLHWAPSNIYVLNAETKELITSYKGCGYVYKLEFLSNDELFIDGNYLGEGDGGHLACLINLTHPYDVYETHVYGDIPAEIVRFCQTPPDWISEIYGYDIQTSCNRTFNGWKKNYSLENDLIALVESSNAITIRNFRSGDMVQQLEYEGIQRNHVMLSNNGKRLAVLDKDNRLHIVSTESGTKLLAIEPLETEADLIVDQAEIIDIAPNKQGILTSYIFNQANTPFKQETVLWSLENGKPLLSFTDTTYHYNRYFFSDDGTHLFRNHEGVLEVWNLQTLSKTHEFSGNNDVAGIKMNQDKTHLYAFTQTYPSNPWGVKVWDLTSHETIHHFEDVVSLYLDAAKNNFYLSDRDGIVKSWKIGESKELDTYYANYTYVEHLAITGDSRYLLTLSESTIILWDIRTGQEIRTRDFRESAFSRFRAQVFDVHLSQDNQTLLILTGVSGYDIYGLDRLFAWNFVEDVLLELPLAYPYQFPYYDSYNPDNYGLQLPLPNHETFDFDMYNIRIKNENYNFSINLEHRHTPQLCQDAVLDPRKTLCAKVQEAGNIHVINAATGELRSHLEPIGDPEDVFLSFSNERYPQLAVANKNDGIIRIYNANSGNLNNVLWASFYNSKILSMSFSPNPSLLEVQYESRGFFYWDIAKRKLVPQNLFTHGWRYSPVYPIDFSSNGNVLTVHNGEHILLRNPRNQEAITGFRQTGKPAFSPNGRYLFVSSGESGSSHAVSVYGAADGSRIFRGRTSQFVYDDSHLHPKNELLKNGHFSLGQEHWELEGDFWAGTTFTYFHNLPGYAASGVNTAGDFIDDAQGSISQTFVIPEATEELEFSFWYNITSNEREDIAHDVMLCMIYTEDDLLAWVHKSNRDSAISADAHQYKQEKLRFDVQNAQGKMAHLKCEATSNGSFPTIFRLDELSLLAHEPS